MNNLDRVPTGLNVPRSRLEVFFVWVAHTWACDDKFTLTILRWAEEDNQTLNLPPPLPVDILPVCVKALKTEKIVNLALLCRSVRATIYGTFNADQFVRCLISATIAHATGNTSFWYISAQRFCFGAEFDRGVVLVHGRGVVLVHENGTLRWSASRQNQPPFSA